MTVDEIKQALREMKERCENTIKCSECPFAVGKIKHCLMIDLDGDDVIPSEWPLDWPDADQIAKANATDPLTLSDYQRMARRTAGTKQKSDKREEAMLGLAGEVGELCDHYKKYKHQGHAFDRDHMIEEAGDVLWYLSELADGLDISLEDIAIRNIEKLARRYPDGFDPERSMHREEEQLKSRLTSRTACAAYTTA